MKAPRQMSAAENPRRPLGLEAEARRIGDIAQISSSLGFAIGGARFSAFVLYGYVVAESQRAPRGSAAHRIDRDAVVERRLLQTLA